MILFFPLIFFHLKCKVGNLSGGERNRVQLAKLLKAGGNMIILDEPSVSIIQRGNMNLNFLKRLKIIKKHTHFIIFLFRYEFFSPKL